MAMFEKFRDKAMNLAEVGMSKAKEMGEITKLNLANASEEENIKKAYLEIGKIYYAANCLNPDPVYAEYCVKISECKSRIEINKAKITAIKMDDEEKAEACGCCEEGVPSEEIPPEEPIEPKE